MERRNYTGSLQCHCWVCVFLRQYCLIFPKKTLDGSCKFTLEISLRQKNSTATGLGIYLCTLREYLLAQLLIHSCQMSEFEVFASWCVLYTYIANINNIKMQINLEGCPKQSWSFVKHILAKNYSLNSVNLSLKIKFGIWWNSRITHLIKIQLCVFKSEVQSWNKAWYNKQGYAETVWSWCINHCRSSVKSLQLNKSKTQLKSQKALAWWS